MDDSTQDLIELAAAYMEHMEDISGGSVDPGFVVDLINDTYGLLTGDEDPVLKIQYKGTKYDQSDPIDNKPNSISKKSDKYIRNQGFTPQEEGAEREFPHIMPEMEEDIKDALNHVHAVFEDVTFALEVSEEDNEAVQEENKRLALKNENLLKQAKALYNRNEYLSIHNRNLQETIDDIFTQGGNAEEAKEETEE